MRVKDQQRERYISVHLHTSMYLSIYRSEYALMPVNRHGHACMHMNIQRERERTYVAMCMCECECVCVRVCVCARVCMQVHAQAWVSVC